MPKNKVNDPITDKEIAFARLVLSGAMTDRQAAEAVGLNPDSAAYIKSKPHVRAFMLEHRAAVQKELVQQDADLSRREVEEQRRLNLNRERVLERLWEIAKLTPEMTRGSITGQVKALSLIIAMENFIPNRLAISSQKKSTPAPTPQIDASAWLARQQAATRAATNDDPQPNPAPIQDQVHVGNPPPGSAPSQSTSTSSKTPVAYVPLFTSVPDLGIPFPIKKTLLNPFVRPR